MLPSNALFNVTNVGAVLLSKLLPLGHLGQQFFFTALVGLSLVT